MASYAFETVDVFTAERFGGNPLAVFTDAEGLTDSEMQSLAREFNLSETTFVLPPQNPANSARVRIFNLTTEMPFAGHPSVGTAYVLARNGHPHGDRLQLEMVAGVVAVTIERENGAVMGGAVTAPRPLALGRTFAAETIAGCVGLEPSEIVVRAHEPVLAGTGNPFIFAEIGAEAITRCTPDIAAFRAAAATAEELEGRFALYVYARDGDNIRARMFSPLAGTVEDPATGSAATAIAALQLYVRGGDALAFDIRQGAELGRPSLLRVTSRRTEQGIIATVAGRCAPVLRGVTQ
jgi:trans-2,3-dihydro-3-hydroxyanthranilate isomerase